MPELPEVETVRRYLEPRIKGQSVLALHIYRSKNFEGDVGKYQGLVGKKIEGLDRHGKFLVFLFEGENVLLSHLRMEGKWFLISKDEPVAKHDICRFVLSGNQDLVYNDTRKFGFLALRDKANYVNEAPISALGKEPWAMEGKELYALLQKKKTKPVKEAIMDQTLMAGLGNIYADEVLFASLVNPRTPSVEITEEQAEKIVLESRRILDLAIEYGGSTVHSYAFAQGEKGHMQTFLQVYGKEGGYCKRCGAPLRKITVGGRGTTYCPFCQKEPNRPLVYAVTGPIASGKSSVVQILIDKGYSAFSADQTVGKLYEGPAVASSLSKALGQNVADKNGQVDRKVLLSLMKDGVTKAKVEEVVHPLVYERFLSFLKSKRDGRVIIEIPLFAHSPYEDETDFLIYIGADEKTRERRLLDRNVDPKAYLELAKGYPAAYLRKKASLVLDGSKGLSELEKQIAECPYL